jgi:hypothetical protein
MAEKKPDDKPEAPKLVSLKDFIEDYQKLIAVAGVFVALALFWKSIRSEESTPYISYLCLLITLPILFEVNRGYNYEKSTWTLIAFMQIFDGIILFTLYYVLVSYPNHLEKILRGIVFFALFIGLINLVENMILSKLRKKDHDERVQLAKQRSEQGVPVDDQQKLVDLDFKASNMYLTFMEILCVAGVFCLTLLILTLIDPYVIATFDEIFDRAPHMDAPKSDLELPKP